MCNLAVASVCFASKHRTAGSDRIGLIARGKTAGREGGRFRDWREGGGI